MLQHQVRWALKMLWPGLYVSCVQLFPHPSRNPLLQATLIWGLVNSNFAIWEIPERQVLIALPTINAWTGGQVSTLFVWASQFNQNAKLYRAMLLWHGSPSGKGLFENLGWPTFPNSARTWPSWMSWWTICF
jgi:hypothetical protein